MASSDHAGGDLRAKVAAIRTRLAQLKASSDRIGEQNTKATLIEPILLALGWDIYNPDEVDREYRHQPSDDPVDYALKLDGRPVLFVEAKALRVPLGNGKWVKQLLSYGVVAGVDWCVLTNGDEYRIYNAHAPVEATEKLFQCFSISDVEAEEEVLRVLELLSKLSMAAGRLTTLWQEEFVGRCVLAHLQELVATKNKSLIRLLRKSSPLDAEQPQAIRDALDAVQITLEGTPSAHETPTEAAPAADQPPQGPAKAPAPTRPRGRRQTTILRLGSDVFECPTVRAIIEHTASWLIRQGKLGPEHCPLTVTRSSGHGQKRCLINSRPVHPGGHKFVQPTALENGLYVETHASRLNITQYARRLVEWAGYDRSILQLDED
ncbi:MAG: hypothetical protein GX358_09725 [candidate division WS1 bacterium]|nr:hypothetical protein [candidate division WS1 bacterium]